MKPLAPRPFVLLLIAAAAALALTSCGGVRPEDDRNKMIVSVRDQRMLLVRDGQPVKSYRISTSKFGLGSEPGSYRTPIGRMKISRKIGDRAPVGMVFKSRRETGEILRPDAPGRDPIVSRILWLDGKDRHNRNTRNRLIYIHGTPEERRLGTPASYGCIRMGMTDVVDLYGRVGYGAEVRVIRGPLLDTGPGRVYAARRGQSGAADPTRG